MMSHLLARPERVTLLTLALLFAGCASINIPRGTIIETSLAAAITVTP
jgi:hypothetical protein